MYDIIVIGGGPAGMTAALYALRNKKTVLVIEKGGFGGQISYSPKVENFPGTLQMSGNEFADALLDQIMTHGADIESDTVTEIKDDGATKRVFTEDGAEFEAKAIIIATGVKHRMLGLEGEYELVGNGISFCAVCDGDFYSNQTVYHNFPSSLFFFTLYVFVYTLSQWHFPFSHKSTIFPGSFPKKLLLFFKTLMFLSSVRVIEISIGFLHKGIFK